MAEDIYGQAILDYYKGERPEPLLLHNSYGDPEEMPVEVFFREEIDFTTIEHLAIMECKGDILDIGAAAGAISLVLQNLGKKVYAMDNSPGCCEVMRHSGINYVLEADYRKHLGKYDTILLMMNGIGIAGSLSTLPSFLNRCKSLLNPGGQILLDSSDIAYLYKDGTPKPSGYLGDIRYQYEYKQVKSGWFDWLYVDRFTLEKFCDKAGLKVEILVPDENDQYLARLTMYE